MEGIHTHFTWIDWTVMFGYLLLTTWIGHALRGKQSTMRDFFLAGRSLPWPAVCGSMVATEISAVTFIGVPATVLAVGGNFTYLQWAIGSIIARIIVGLYLTRVYYEREIFSPYDYMEYRIGHGIRKLTTLLFTLGGVLGQSVRLLVPALILRTVTPLSFETCIVIIGVVSIIWTLMGGMTTVIWTDVIQFFVFVLGGLLALFFLIQDIQGGWTGFIAAASEAGKLQVLDLSWQMDARFTLWVGILAMPFQNLAAFGTDQLNAQRMLCCRNAREAGYAVIGSSIGQLVTLMMLLVGAGLWVYYQQNPPVGEASALFEEDLSYVFPVWITTVLPSGLTGLVLAGAFAAAISSMDSALAALSQTTLSVIHSKHGLENADQSRMIVQSRIAVILWGLALPLAALGLNLIKEDIDLIGLAFGMVAYTYGPMLGILLLALCPFKKSIVGIWIGLSLSILLVLYARPDVWNALQAAGLITDQFEENFRPELAFPWFYPIATTITFVGGTIPAIWSRILGRRGTSMDS